MKCIKFFETISMLSRIIKKFFMKFKYIKRTAEEVETDLELPIYLYFQDDLCYDTLVKVSVFCV